jgi:hypothetical protein
MSQGLVATPESVPDVPELLELLLDPELPLLVELLLDPELLLLVELLLDPELLLLVELLLDPELPLLVELPLLPELLLDPELAPPPELLAPKAPLLLMPLELPPLAELLPDAETVDESIPESSCEESSDEDEHATNTAKGANRTREAGLMRHGVLSRCFGETSVIERMGTPSTAFGSSPVAMRRREPGRTVRRSVFIDVGNPVVCVVFSSIAIWSRRGRVVGALDPSAIHDVLRKHRVS